MERQRDLSLDIAKGICIILMVLGHSGCPEWINRFMALFRMPCFFFISGILLNERYLTDVKGGIRKKLKGYYRPFVKWTLIFLFLHNVFVQLHIYENNYTWQEIAVKVIRTITMTGGEQLLGGYWFLISLTWASVGSILIFSFLKKKDKLTPSYIVTGLFLMIIIASTHHLLPIRLPAQFGPQTFLALAFFMTGYLYRKTGLHPNEHKSHLNLLLLLFPAIASIFVHDLSMSSAGSLSWLYYILAMAGTIGFLQFAIILQSDKMAIVFDYIGNKTLYILTFHFLSFKFISYLWIKHENLPISNLSQFPVLEKTNSWMWIVYSIAGIALPLLIWELFHLPYRLGKSVKDMT